MQTDKPGSLNDKFEHVGAAPSDQLWSAIEKSLDQDTRKKRGAFWWWFGGLAAGLVLIVSVYRIGYYVGKTETASTAENHLSLSSQTTQPAQIHAASNEQPTADMAVNESDNGLQTTRLNPSEQNQQDDNINALSENGDVQHQPEHQRAVNTYHTEAQSHAGDVSLTQQSSSTTEQLIPDFALTNLPANDVAALRYQPLSAFALKSPALEKRKPTGRWELGFSAGILGGYQTLGQKASMWNGQQSLTDNTDSEVEGFANLDGTGFTPTAVNNVPVELESSVKRPVQVEFSIARNLGRRWSLGSGIGLSYLCAVNIYSGPMDVESRANVFSFSVPLITDFDIVKRRRVEISLGAGVINEFPFRTYTEKTYISPMAAKEINQGFNYGYMGSVLFRTSFAYRLNESWSLNLSPNLRYYFHQSIQSDVPVLKRNNWAGISVGVTKSF